MYVCMYVCVCVYIYIYIDGCLYEWQRNLGQPNYGHMLSGKDLRYVCVCTHVGMYVYVCICI